VLATSSQIGTAKVWEARTSQELLTLKGHTKPVTCVSFSPGGQRLATGNEGETVMVWDARVMRPPDAEELLIRRARTGLDVAWHHDQANQWQKDQNWPAAAFHLEQTVIAQPSDKALIARLQQILSRAVKQQPEQGATWRLALVQLHAGEANGFHACCQRMQQRFRAPDASLHALLLTVRTAVLCPDGLTEPEARLPLLPPGEKLLRGAALCRAGKHVEAVKELADEKTPVACHPPAPITAPCRPICRPLFSLPVNSARSFSRSERLTGFTKWPVLAIPGQADSISRPRHGGLGPKVPASGTTG
jgi:hypothetical protein